MVEDRVLNFNEVREYLGVSRPTLLKYIREGRIRAFKWGGRAWRVRLCWLHNFMDRESDESSKQHLRERDPFGYVITEVGRQQLTTFFQSCGDCHWLKQNQVLTDLDAGKVRAIEEAPDKFLEFYSEQQAKAG